MILVYELNTLLAISFAMLMAVFFVIPFLIVVAREFRLVDSPNHRKHHIGAIPVVGGIAIYITIFLSLFLVSHTEKLTWLMGSASIILATGILDDRIGLSVRVRLLAQVLATAMMVFGTDLSIESLGINFADVSLLAGLGGLLFTFVAVVGLTNAFNMIDGIDGLASGHVLVSLASLALVSTVNGGTVHQYAWLVILASPVFAFWLVNVSLIRLGKIFLGDAGSMVLGFLLAWTLIYYSQEPVSLVNPMMTIWCVALPVWDTLLVILRRLKNRQSPFVADRNHLHHLVIDMGFEPNSVMACMLFFATAISLLGFWVTTKFGAFPSLVIYLFLLFCVGYVAHRCGAKQEDER